MHVHVHASVRRAGEVEERLKDMAAYFKAGRHAPTIHEIAAYYRERKMAAVVFGVDVEAANEHAGRATRRSPSSPPSTPTC